MTLPGPPLVSPMTTMIHAIISLIIFELKYCHVELFLIQQQINNMTSIYPTVFASTRCH